MKARRQARERGASLVEAALIVPLLLIIAATVVDLGRAYFTYVTIIDAAREGARYGANHPNDTGGICSRVLAEAQGQTLPVTLSCANVEIESTGAVGTPIRVTVTVRDFQTYLGGLVGRSTFPITHSAVFRIYCGGGTC